MSFPEKIGPICGDKLVVHVVAVCHLEWWVLSKHNKEDNTASKEVNDLTLIRLFLEDFRCHVAWCSNHRSVETAAISSFQRAREAKIYNFDVVVLVE